MYAHKPTQSEQIYFSEKRKRCDEIVCAQYFKTGSDKMAAK